VVFFMTVLYLICNSVCSPFSDQYSDMFMFIIVLGPLGTILLQLVDVFAIFSCSSHEIGEPVR
jgi:hypothetical protein